MDVTSLLNVSCVVGGVGGIVDGGGGTGGGMGLQRRDSVASSTPSATGDTTATSTAVPTPSPEQSRARNQSPFGRASGSRSPTNPNNKNRTPWDAGGYSLPLSIDTKSIPSPPSCPTFLSESPTANSPTSGGHKYSISRSSLSSNNSLSTTASSSCHSRISSLSTVSENYQTPNFFNHIKPSSYFDNTRTVNNTTSFFAPKMADQGSSGGQRPRSPSDALMIRRGSEAATAGSRSNSPIDLAADPSDYGSPPAGHRRVISAPASQQVPSASPDHSDHDGSSHGSSRADADADDTMTEVGEYELATSLVDLVMGRTHHAMQAYDSLEELASHINYRGERQCGFMEGCDYMAEARQRGISIPMRKVISHLFGRNKTCTRSVPDQVWYCVCRKHYQRGRYRNQQDFMINLCTYVITQTLRIVAWSNDNVRNGTPEDGGLMNWTLTPRRREQARREAKDGKDKASGKRKYEDDEDAAEDDDDDDAAEIQYPSASNGVPVPDWLYDMCYKEYLTREVIEIVYRIRGEIEAGNLIGFPDVEFLPNISGANAKPKPKAKSKAKEAKGRTKKPAAASNRVGPTRISARSAINHDEDDEDYKPRSKRQRYEAEMEAQAVAPPRNSGRTVPYFGNGGTVPAASPLQQVPSRGGYHQRSVSDVSGVNTTNWSARPSAPVPAQYGYQQHPGGAVAYDHYIQGGHPSSSNSYSNMGGPAGAPSVFRGARVPDGPEFVVGGAAEMDRAFHQRREFMLQQQQREFAQGQGYRPQEAFGGGGAGSYHYGGTGYGGAALGSGAKHSRNQSTPSVLGGGAGYGPIPGQYPAPSQPDLRRASYQIPPPPPRR